jgi:hypothetical protein
MLNSKLRDGSSILPSPADSRNLENTVSQLQLHNSSLTPTHMTLITHLDPLEQFDVLSTSLPIVGSFGLTNLALLLAFNIVLMTA